MIAESQNTTNYSCQYRALSVDDLVQQIYYESASFYAQSNSILQMSELSVEGGFSARIMP